MIAVIVAMEKEASRIVSELKDVRVTEYASRSFYEGVYGGENVVVALAGIGKVASATTTAITLERYKPRAVINTGIAGGLGILHPMDVLVATETWQHDFDLTALGEGKGICSGKTDEALNEILLLALGKAHRGAVATGDVFVADSAISAQIAREFDAKACDMECSAVAKVCADYGVPFAAIKVISDGAEDGAGMDYVELSEKACAINAGAALKAISTLVEK